MKAWRLPRSKVAPMTIRPPKYSTATVAPFMASIMMGMMAMIRMPTFRPA